jgi:hypothetical protein
MRPPAPGLQATADLLGRTGAAGKPCAVNDELNDLVLGRGDARHHVGTAGTAARHRSGERQVVAGPQPAPLIEATPVPEAEPVPSDTG